MDATRFFGIKLIDTQDFTELLLRFFFNLVIAFVIVRYVYYPASRRKEYLFTYLIISIVVFFLCHLLSNVKLSLGFALGLFAIFSIIRYRTDTVPIKEMTYLFVVIGISVINALSTKKVSYLETLFTNLAILFAIYIMEKIWRQRGEARQEIIYENIDLIKPGKQQELIEDLKVRTGLNIKRVEVGRIDFLRDTAMVTIFYDEDNSHL